MSHVITIRETNQIISPVQPKPDHERLHSSASQSKHARGRLRMRAVDNGRYDRWHAIENAQGVTEGYLVNGWEDLAYTYGFLSPEHHARLYVPHVRYRANKGCLSIIAQKGYSLVKRAPKFQAIESHVIDFPIVYGPICDFRFLDVEQQNLLLISEKGFFVFDTRSQSFMSNRAWDDGYQYARSIAVSPTSPIVANASIEFVREDPLDGSSIFRSTVKIYDLRSGQLLGSHDLPGSQGDPWTISFSADGRGLSARRTDQQIGMTLETTV